MTTFDRDRLETENASQAKSLEAHFVQITKVVVIEDLGHEVTFFCSTKVTQILDEPEITRLNISDNGFLKQVSL